MTVARPLERRMVTRRPLERRMVAMRPLERRMVARRPLERWMVLLPAHVVRPPIALVEALEVWLLERQGHRKWEGVEVKGADLCISFGPHLGIATHNSWIDCSVRSAEARWEMAL